MCRLSRAISGMAKDNLDSLRYYALALEYTKKFANERDLLLVRGLIEHLITAIFAHLDLHTVVIPNYWEYDLGGYKTLQSIKDFNMLHLFKLCYEFSDQVLSLCERLVRRLHPPGGVDKKKYVNRRLFPVLAYLTTHAPTDVGLDFTTGALRDFAVLTFHLYVTKSLGPKPAEQITEGEIARVGCGCDDCKMLVERLRNDQPKISIAKAKAARTHLERQLVSASVALWGVTWTTSTAGVPHQLEVCLFRLGRLRAMLIDLDDQDSETGHAGSRWQMESDSSAWGRRS